MGALVIILGVGIVTLIVTGLYFLVMMRGDIKEVQDE